MTTNEDHMRQLARELLRAAEPATAKPAREHSAIRFLHWAKTQAALSIASIEPAHQMVFITKHGENVPDPVALDASGQVVRQSDLEQMGVLLNADTQIREGFMTTRFLLDRHELETLAQMRYKALKPRGAQESAQLGHAFRS